MFGGTPDMLLDTRRGLYSYPALQSRLAENSFKRPGLVDFSGPVMRLANLSPEDMYVLLAKLRHVFAGGDPDAYLVPDEALTAFMTHCAARVGDAYFRTPRTTIKEFVDLLSVLDQNPGVGWSDLIDRVEIEAETNPDLFHRAAAAAPRSPIGKQRPTMTTSSISVSEASPGVGVHPVHPRLQRWIYDQEAPP